MAYDKPLPQPSPDTKAFWEGCREHEIRIQKCGECGRLRWPPAFLCPGCLSKHAQWVAATGRGTVYSYVVYHVAYHPAFREDLPYVLALVELEEGPHFVTNIVGCEPGAVSCGMAVEVIWDDVTETVSLPKFRPAVR
jgi:uncharacterized OB-fold protein